MAVVVAEIRDFGGKCLDVRGPSTADALPCKRGLHSAAEQLWSPQCA